MFRDRIKALTQIQSHQSINNLDIDEADVFALHANGPQACIQVFFLRGGQNLGNRPYFSTLGADADEGEALSSLIGQFYTNRPPPKLILVSHALPEAELLEKRAVARSRLQGEDRPAAARAARRSDGAGACQCARGAGAAGGGKQHAAQAARRPGGPARVWNRCPSASRSTTTRHIQGSDAVGAMIVAGPDGFVKNAYRKFNIRTAIVDGEGGPTAKASRRATITA